MVQIMCERVNLHLRVGLFILSMRRLHHRLPGGVVDMMEVAQLIKYVSEHKEDLRPQFRIWKGRPAQQDTSSKPANFTFLK